MTMKKVSGDLAKNRDYLDRQLGVGESFDVLYRNVEIGKKNAALYMIDGFCKDEVMQKLLQHFIGITKEQMPEDAAEMSRQLVPYGEVDLCGDLDEICRQAACCNCCSFSSLCCKCVAGEHHNAGKKHQSKEHYAV